MTPSEIASIRAEALFASTVQESETPSPAAVHAAVQATLLRYGTRGCALVVAEEFGEHPGEAVRRMAWVLRMLRVAYARPAPDPAAPVSAPTSLPAPVPLGRRRSRPERVATRTR